MYGFLPINDSSVSPLNQCVSQFILSFLDHSFTIKLLCVYSKSSVFCISKHVEFGDTSFVGTESSEKLTSFICRLLWHALTLFLASRFHSNGVLCCSLSCMSVVVRSCLRLTLVLSLMTFRLLFIKILYYVS